MDVGTGRIQQHCGDGRQALLTLAGAGGTLILSDTSNYTGGTNVDAGTLIATDNGALSDNTSLTIGAGGAFIFDPTVSAAPAGAAPQSAAPVPEPGTIALLLAAFCSAAIYRRFAFGVRRGQHACAAVAAFPFRRRPVER